MYKRVEGEEPISDKLRQRAITHYRRLATIDRSPRRVIDVMADSEPGFILVTTTEGKASYRFMESKSHIIVYPALGGRMKTLKENFLKGEELGQSHG